jgi:hypothetical protein
MQEQGKQAVKSKGNHRQQSSLFQNIENKAPENKQTLFVAGIGALRGKRVKLLLQFLILTLHRHQCRHLVRSLRLCKIL